MKLSIFKYKLSVIKPAPIESQRAILYSNSLSIVSFVPEATGVDTSFLAVSSATLTPNTRAISL